MTALSPRRTFSGTALKTIACITMLVDHIGASCIEAGILTPGLDAGTLSQDALSAYPLYRLDMVLRFTGRLAFPLFCFLLVEGFVHTHNVKGYLGRLVLFGLLSEVPFDLAFFRTPFYPGAQNVYWTLALGVLAMGMMYRSGMSKMGDYYAAGQKMNNTIVEYINGMEVVKVFNRDGESYHRFETDVKNYRDFTLDWFRACLLYTSPSPRDCS